MKKSLVIIAIILVSGFVGVNEANAQTIGHNAKALAVQVYDSVKSKTPVFIDSVKSKTPVFIDSVKSKTPVVIDSIKSKGAKVGDKAAVAADSLFTKGKRWIEKRKKH